jgi:isoquinoline 1-oxidoreductase beta subunit
LDAASSADDAGIQGVGVMVENTDGLTRRQMIAVLIGAPTLTMAGRWVGEPEPAAATARAPGSRVATPGIPDILDLTDALTLAALPTAGLLVIEVTTGNRVTFRLPRSEVGQGITTSTAMIVAEELGARLADVDVVLEDARPELLFNQLTGGSNSIHALYPQIRTVAAAVRARLITAAARRWSLPARTLVARDTQVVAPDGRTASFGSLTEEASQIVVPEVPATPKDPSTFTVIGTPTTRLDARDIVTGRAEYAMDLDVPGAKPTVVARPPTIGGSVSSVDDAAARAMPGVLAVTRIPTGVAVTANTFDEAQRARDALEITWNPGPNAALDDEDIRAQLKAAVLPFVLPPLGVLTVDRSFNFAFAPHAPLEVWNCIADVRHDRAELWVSSKTPIVAAQSVAATIGLPADAVTLHVIRGGGSFGHRLFWDPATEAAQVSQAIGRPVKLMWTRNDDMRQGRMRPMSHHKVRATHLLGNVLAYEHRVGTLPVDFGHGLGEALTAVGFDLGAITVTQGVFQLTQKVPYNFGVETQLLTDVAVPSWPTSSWRSIYSGQVATVNEVMVDEIARALRKDPMAFRLAKASSARTRAVLNKLRTAGSWGRPMPAGTAQGVAIWEEYKGSVGFLVEIDCRDLENPRVTKGVCAVDPGRAINPRGLAAQMQGVLIDGLSMTLQAGLHVVDGAVVEGSYSDYRYARMRHSPPTIDVHVMPPTGEPGGAGELGFPAAAAAVANAYARATGTTSFNFPIAG